MKVNHILETIGQTPHIKVNKLFDPRIQVWVKSERQNPGGSIKDRIALAMVEDAEKKGILKPNSVIIEPTSGNTGIGLAMVAAVKGYRLILVMPESMSVERRQIMAAYGAHLELTPKEKGMPGAIERAKTLVMEQALSWMPMQFENEVNIDIHRKTTAREILADFHDGLDYLITGVGTGGHISGCAYELKKHFPRLKVFAVEPSQSPVISGGTHSPHRIQGIGAGFIPKNLNVDILDGTIQVTEEEAFLYAQRAAKEEGLFVGISSGAAFAAVAKQQEKIASGSVILTFCYDTGERYLSIENLFRNR